MLGYRSKKAKRQKILKIIGWFLFIIVFIIIAIITIYQYKLMFSAIP